MKQTAAIRDKMHQIATPICVDAIHSPNALKERTRLYRYIELRGLFSAPIPLTVVAMIAFVVVGYAPRPDNPQRFDSLQVSRLFADRELIIPPQITFIKLDKESPAERLRKERQMTCNGSN